MFANFRKGKKAKRQEKAFPWWKSRVVYQIYPRSFCDSNGDGIGDLKGILSKLDYLKSLGVGILWLSPVYCSPNDDNGYDISDYKKIHPDFGTLEEMKQLIDEAKKREIKIIMDLVINHTSDEHEWFKQSRSSKENPYRNYYIWKEGKKGKAPNNWSSFFSGSAWEKEEQTGEYYLHLFSKKQPDLNWKNPKVVEEIHSILKFWLDLGIAGFRCDVINVIYKTALSNGKKRLILTGREHYLSQEGCHQILKTLRKEIFSHYDCFTVGETVLVTTDMAKDLCDERKGELDMVFSFEHMDIDCINNKWFKKPFNPDKLFTVLEKWQQEIEWNANYFENHDQPRLVSRYGNFFGKREEQTDQEKFAKLMACLLFTLRGTPFIYQGQEIGMTNGDFKTLADFQDVETININRLMQKLKFPRSLAWSMLLKSSRDNARTPMQWNEKEGAGFTSGTPWIKINSNHTLINVEEQSDRLDSILSTYKQLITLREQNPALLKGSFRRIKGGKKLFAYLRFLKEQEILILLNFSKKPIPLENPIHSYLTSSPSFSILYTNEQKPHSYLLQPYEARVILLHSSPTSSLSSISSI